ncbi:metal ABC transporter substrate-binding protein [Hoyosella sp. G463]|uniref:Metal ABC transporter substrate-binding protein n=1 Tax=Lolliginicoccus lacisalsi TaxID=2742202 RepID=A0A927PK90_9ACTN|nr:metal ABC transporter substrate-binding protein [Lolliginicoccus lacisalsi]MBD8505443.1 metal ABC transporter substrate-binding protein [Lolliginicoccus lacisalsi]
MTNIRVRWTKSRVAPLLVALATILAVPACASDGPGEPTSAASGKPIVLTTFTVLANIASNVAGDHLVVESITKPGSEIHGYEPTPSDLRTAEQASLILDNGLGLESWFERFVTTAGAPHSVVSEGIDPIAIAAGDYEGKANPHAWMSPIEAQVYIDNIAAAFADLDPANAADYRANADEYKAEVARIGDELITALDSVPPAQRALVSCEGAFSYLARDAGLQEQYLWAVNQEQESAPREIARLVDFVRDNEVPSVFCESTVSDRGMQQVAREAGTSFGGILYVDSLSEPDGPVPTYLDLLRHDVTVIIEGLTTP